MRDSPGHAGTLAEDGQPGRPGINPHLFQPSDCGPFSAAVFCDKLVKNRPKESGNGA